MQKYRMDYTFLELLWEQVKEFKLYYVLGIICLFATHLIQSELPFMAKKMAELISIDIDQTKPGLFFLLALGIIIFRTSSRVLFFYPARILQKNLRSELVSKCEAASPWRYRHLNNGQIFQYLTSDIDQIRALLGFVALQGGNFLIAMVVLIPKLISFNIHLLIALIPMLVAFLIFTVVVSKNRSYFKKTQESEALVQNLIIETYLGKKTIKNFHAEETFTALFKEMSLRELYYFYRSSLGISFTFPLITFSIGLSLLWGAYIIRSENLGASSLILFSGFIYLFMEPLGYLSWVGVVISRSNASFRRLKEFDHLLRNVTSFEQDLVFKNKNLSGLEFNLPYWDLSLNLKLIQEKWNVIIAKTGDGKSELLIKMADILKARGSALSLVTQDPYVYNDTVLKNIFLGKIPDENLLKSAKIILRILGLDYIEPDLDKLLDLEVGENGKRLSGGQMKRLCLIRSLMSGADVLVWDDPFSSVDLILEKEIIDDLKNQDILKSKTIILTSHRLSTVKNSDIIIFIDKDLGIVEQGNSRDLLKPTTKTYEYFKKQMV